MYRILFSFLFVISGVTSVFAGITNNLDSHWKMNDVTDSVGAGNLTNQGSVSFSGNGKVGTNASNYGTSNTTKLLNATSHFSYNEMGASWTVSMWVKLSTMNQSPVFFANFANNTTYTRQMYIGLDASDQLFLSFYDGTGFTASDATGALSYDTWYLITATYNGLTLKLYKDTTMVGSFDRAFSAGYGAVSDNMSIGGYQIVSAGTIYAPTSGLIDEVRLYSRALTSTDVSELFAYSGVVPSGGGGGLPSTDEYLSASYYSQYSSSSPSAVNGSINFIAPPVASSTLQGATIFIVHTSTSSPVVSWSGSSTIFYASTSMALTYYVTSVYHLPVPVSGNVVISNVSTSSIKYVNATVWDNGNLVANTDTYNTFFGFNKAYVNLSNITIPVLGISSIQTLTGLQGFNIVNGNAISVYATSSTIGDFAIQYASCSVGYDDCFVGYNKNGFSFIDSSYASIVGLGLYSIASVSYSSSTPPTFITTVFGDKGTVEGFAQCSSLLSFGTIINSLSCLMQNLFFWFMYLFIPAPNSYVGLQSMLYNAMNSTSSLLSGLASVPLQFVLWTSTTSVPAYDGVGIDIPHFNDTGTYEFRFSGTSSPAFARIDTAIYKFIDLWFPLLIAVWIGLIGFNIFFS